MNLFDWQKPLFEKGLSIFQQRGIVLYTLCPGAGKTVISLLTAKAANKLPLICAPKSTITQWIRTCDRWEVDYLDVMNIEKLRTGKTKYVRKWGEGYIWNLPDDTTCVIWDESHNLTGLDSQQSKLLAATYQLVKKGDQAVEYKLPVMLLSATLIDSALRLRGAVGYRLGLFEQSEQGGVWCMQNGCFINEIWQKVNKKQADGSLKKVLVSKQVIAFPRFGDPRRQPALEKLNATLSPFNVNIVYKDIPGFPEHRLVADVYDLPPAKLKQLNELYAILQERKIEGGNTRPFEKQQAEILKVDLFIDLTNQHLSRNCSVIIFVSHRAVALELNRLIPNSGLLIGDQDTADRDAVMKRFLADEIRVVIATHGAGGEGIELHDSRGEFPRVALISPPDAARMFIQACGRHHRATALSPATSYLILVAGSVEEKIKRNLDDKLENLNTIQDTDLQIGE